MIRIDRGMWLYARVLLIGFMGGTVLASRFSLNLKAERFAKSEAVAQMQGVPTPNRAVADDLSKAFEAGVERMNPSVGPIFTLEVVAT